MTKPLDDALAAKMELVAASIADDLIADGTPKKGKIDAFKVLTGYFTSTRKLGTATPDDDDSFDFSKAKARMIKTNGSETKQ